MGNSDHPLCPTPAVPLEQLRVEYYEFRAALVGRRLALVLRAESHPTIAFPDHMGLANADVPNVLIDAYLRLLQ